MTRIKMLALLPNLNGGGAERVMLHILRDLDRRKFELTLALGRATGPLMPLIPSDVRLVEFQKTRAAHSVLDTAREFRRGRYDLCFSMISMNLTAVIARVLSRDDLRLVLGARSHYTRSIGTEASASALKLASVRLLYPKADLIVAVSEGVRADLIRNLHVPPDKVVTIHNPIDLAEVRRLAAEESRHTWLSANSGIPTIVAIGALRRAKGYPDLLDAFRIVRKHHDVRLLIVGEGPLRSSIEGHIARHDLGADVALVGFDANPYKYLGRATLFVHAALWEGFPNVLLEAMACGVPVVATDCPSGPAEIIQSGRNGRLVPVSAPAEMAAAIETLLADAALRRQFAEQASKDVERFSATTVLAQYADIFTRLGSADPVRARHRSPSVTAVTRHSNSLAMPCPGCGREGSRAGEKDGFMFAVCRCGTLYVPERDHAKFDYESGSGCLYDYVAPDISMRSLAGLVDNLAQYRLTNRWLDMGFGRGELLAVCLDKGWDCYGTELSEKSLEVGRQSGWHVTADDSELEPATFDVVTMNGFIEHVADPDTFIKAAVRLLRPGGVLWISTPNAQSLNRRLLGLSWSAVEPPQHLIIWSPDGLGAALTRHGLAIKQIECTGLSPYALLLRLSGGRREGAAHDALDAKLNAVASRSRLAKRALNGTLSLLRMGDTLKVWAERPKS